MANRSGARGYHGECRWLPFMQRIFGPYVDLSRRHKLAGTTGVMDRGDFCFADGSSLGVIAEAKDTATPLFLEWAERAEAQAAKHDLGHRWFVMWKGDLRRKRRSGPYVLMSADFAEELLMSWQSIPPFRGSPQIRRWDVV